MVATKDNNSANIDSAMKNLDASPSLDQKADELRDKLKAILIKVKEFALTAQGQDAKVRAARTNQLNVEFIAWRKEYNQWLKTGARNHSGLNEVSETK